MNSQYKKGVLELCVLSLLKKRDCYGYEISEYLSQHIDIADGTVYPILRKLKADGLLTTYYVCCSSAFPNTFTFSEPWEAVYMAWFAAACGYDGMLRWSYNSWPAKKILQADGPRSRDLRAGQSRVSQLCAHRFEAFGGGRSK